ncbi:putative dehydrogenase [Rhizobium sp. PP-F2F-G38]|nr:putative dehydrogenase [Rhizobium sp. PP-F2F-G38]
MCDPLRVLLSGPGLIGVKHVSLLNQSPHTELVGLVAPNHVHNIEFAAAQGVPRFNLIEDALALGGVNAVIVSSPNANHFEQSRACIMAGLPVLVEKPFTDTLNSAARLVELAESLGTPVLVGHHRTYSPLLEVARNFIVSEQFGSPVSVQGSAMFFKPKDYFEAGRWRTLKGGGPVLINLIHEVGILRHLFGEIESVTAHLSNATRGFEVEDTAAITMYFANGALGSFLLSDTSASSKSWEMTAGENPVYPFFPEQDCYHFAGTMGSIDFPTMRVRSYAGRHQSWWSPFQEQRYDIMREDPLALQLQHFVEVARGHARPRVSARDGYANMVVVEAIRRAAETRREVAISEVSE